MLPPGGKEPSFTLTLLRSPDLQYVSMWWVKKIIAALSERLAGYCVVSFSGWIERMCFSVPCMIPKLEVSSTFPGLRVLQTYFF